MRMRKKPWAEEEAASNQYAVRQPERYCGKWRELFGCANPIHIEIGMGKGGFITGKAAELPNISFIGVERQISVFAAAAKKIRLSDNSFANIRIVCADACAIDQIFAENEVSHIYINFCDPWPKKRYQKRRLTSGGYLKLYTKILKPNGKMELRTDNSELFRFSVNELVENGWKIERAFVRNGMKAQGVMSEYEAKFSKLGKDVYEITARAPYCEKHGV